MILIASIDVLLCHWGRWAFAQARREVGFSSVSPMFRDAAPGRGYGSEPPSGVTGNAADMEAVDRAVVSLPVVLRCVVIQHYQRQSGLRATAAACGISHRSVRQYLNQAHRMIAETIAR